MLALILFCAAWTYLVNDFFGLNKCPHAKKNEWRSRPEPPPKPKIIPDPLKSYGSTEDMEWKKGLPDEIK